MSGWVILPSVLVPSKYRYTSVFKIFFWRNLYYFIVRKRNEQKQTVQTSWNRNKGLETAYKSECVRKCTCYKQTQFLSWGDSVWLTCLYSHWSLKRSLSSLNQDLEKFHSDYALLEIKRKKQTKKKHSGNQPFSS